VVVVAFSPNTARCGELCIWAAESSVGVANSPFWHQSSLRRAVLSRLLAGVNGAGDRGGMGYAGWLARLGVPKWRRYRRHVRGWLEGSCTSGPARCARRAVVHRSPTLTTIAAMFPPSIVRGTTVHCGVSGCFGQAAVGAGVGRSRWCRRPESGPAGCARRRGFSTGLSVTDWVGRISEVPVLRRGSRTVLRLLLVRSPDRFVRSGGGLVPLSTGWSKRSLPPLLTRSLGPDRGRMTGSGVLLSSQTPQERSPFR
jgi:hypothetical protein